MSINLDLVKDKLKNAGVKLTYPRLRILSYLMETKNHPTAEMIYQQIKKEMVAISRATVYNTLELFSNRGIVLPLNIEKIFTRFDGNITPHHHFYCEKCGKLYDLNTSCKYFLRGEISGHKVKKVFGCFQGICKNCQKKMRR